MFYAAAEGIFLLFAILISGDLTHLTWWAIGLLAVHDLTIAVTGTVNWRLWKASMALSSIVQSVVVLMSLMRCKLLRNAYADVGPWTYLVGNFVLHYWPTLRLLGSRPRQIDTTDTLHFDAARIIAAYATIQEPTSVYLCGQVAPWTVMPAGILAAAAFEKILLWMLFRKQHAKFLPQASSRSISNEGGR